MNNKVIDWSAKLYAASHEVDRARMKFDKVFEQMVDAHDALMMAENALEQLSQQAHRADMTGL